MADVTTYLGLEKPVGGEKYSRAMVNRNHDRVEAEAIKRRDKADVPFGHMGKTNGFQGIQTVDTVVTMEAAQVLKGGMIFSDADDALIVPIAGYYRLNAQFYATGGSGAVCSGVIQKNTVSTGIQSRFWKADSGDFMCHAFGIILLAAGDKIRLAMTYSPSSTWGTNGYNGTYLEAEFVGV